MTGERGLDFSMDMIVLIFPIFFLAALLLFAVA